MPTGQQYATNVPQTQLSAPINNIVTSFNVGSQTSWPTPPYTAIIDIATSSQEVVDVVAVVGTSLTVVRAVDGTLAFAHASGASFTHGDIGRDFREARSHIDATGPTDASGHSVHGLTTGAVVGTTEAQTLTNKNLTAPTITSPSIISGGSALTLPSGPDTLVGRASADTLLNKTLTSPTTNGGTSNSETIASGTFSGTSAGTLNPLTLVGANTISVVGNTGAATSFNFKGATAAAGPPTAGTFVPRDVVEDPFTNTLWICTSGGTPGSWAPLRNRVLMGTVSAPTVGFSFSIPAWAQSAVFNKFVIEYKARTNLAGALDSMNMQINGVSSAGTYGYATTVSTTTTGGTFVNNSASATTIPISGLPGATSAANARGAGRIELFVPNGTTEDKVLNWAGSFEFNTQDVEFVGGSGIARVSPAVTAISFAPSTGTQFASSVFNFYAEV